MDKTQNGRTKHVAQTVTFLARNLRVGDKFTSKNPREIAHLTGKTVWDVEVLNGRSVALTMTDRTSASIPANVAVEVDR